MNRVLSTALTFGLASLAACFRGPGEDSSAARQAETAGPHIGVRADTSARACDLLLDLGGAPANGLVFDPAVRGSFVRRATRFAVAVTSRTDAPLPASVGAFETMLPAAPTVVSVACYDRTGSPLSGATVSVQ